MTIKLASNIKPNEIIDTLIKSAILNFRIRDEDFTWDNARYYYVRIPYDDDELIIVCSTDLDYKDEQVHVYLNRADALNLIDYELDIPEQEGLNCYTLSNGDFVVNFK